VPTAAEQQDPSGLVGDSPLDDVSTSNSAAGSGDPVPLFKLAPGVTGTSHGLACARKGGLPEPVLQRAAELMQLMSGIQSSSSSSTSGSSSGEKQYDREGSKARAQLAPRALSMLVSATYVCVCSLC
jgi:DNA mismatch repair ATPase MutS